MTNRSRVNRSGHIGKRFFIKAITSLPGVPLRDQNAGSITVETHSTSGRRWSATCGSSSTGRARVHWTAGPRIYGVSADTPLEAELAFSPSGRHLLALVRLDGNNVDLFGYPGRLRTKVCRADQPFNAFTCPETLDGVRLDGSGAF